MVGGGPELLSQLPSTLRPSPQPQIHPLIGRFPLSKERRPRLLLFIVMFSGFILVFGTLSILLCLTPVCEAPTAHEEIVPIHRGETARVVADRLYKAGLIKSRRIFMAYLKFKGVDRRLQAGYYKVSERMSIPEITAMIDQGRVIRASLTVPEGFTAKEIAGALAKKNLVDETHFLDLVSSLTLSDLFGPRIPFTDELDEATISAIPVHTPGLEGYLFPDTYEIPLGTSEREIIRLMVMEFFRRVVPVLKDTGIMPPFSLRDVIIIASLVEREARLDSERPLVASVFYNRLKLGMPLGSCASIQYLLPHPKARLTLDDLKVPSPYNTYLHPGLPPGPIANPGLSSICAALRPAKTQYLYFVSDNQGGHIFSEDYSDHIKATKKVQTKVQATKVGGIDPRSEEIR